MRMKKFQWTSETRVRLSDQLGTYLRAACVSRELRLRPRGSLIVSNAEQGGCKPLQSEPYI